MKTVKSFLYVTNQTLLKLLFKGNGKIEYEEFKQMLGHGLVR